jgi:hypothetical protein
VLVTIWSTRLEEIFLSLEAASKEVSSCPLVLLFTGHRANLSPSPTNCILIKPTEKNRCSLRKITGTK